MSTRKQRHASKERFWRRVLRQWQRSGLTVRAFCQQHGLSCTATALDLASGLNAGLRDVTMPTFAPRTP